MVYKGTGIDINEVSAGFGLLSGYLDDKLGVAVPDHLFDTLPTGVYFFATITISPIIFSAKTFCSSYAVTVTLSKFNNTKNMVENAI